MANEHPTDPADTPAATDPREEDATGGGDIEQLQSDRADL
jgi:hypothetical protein